MHGTPPCLLNAWSSHAPELKRYFDHRLGDSDEAADLLQDAFIKILRQGRGFCAVRNPRAWLFQVAGASIIYGSRSRIAAICAAAIVCPRLTD